MGKRFNIHCCGDEKVSFGTEDYRIVIKSNAELVMYIFCPVCKTIIAPLINIEMWNSMMLAYLKDGYKIEPFVSDMPAELFEKHQKGPLSDKHIDDLKANLSILRSLDCLTEEVLIKNNPEREKVLKELGITQE